MFLVIVDAHASPAEAAKHAALEQGGSFANRSRSALNAVGLGVVGETNLVRLEALPVDLSRWWSVKANCQSSIGTLI
jgi:hypothetical protein